jgi:aryl-alcohol dehydrogenase-like predicted oxidoreductase
MTASDAGTIAVGSFTVNRMGFGAMRLTGEGIWGEPNDRESAKNVLKRATELGVNFIDTADAYGPETSENIIAETLKPYTGIVIATKGGMTRQGSGQWKPDGSPAHLENACNASLERLGVEVIDVYQLHAPDENVPFEVSLQTLIDLRDQGKIRHIGLSNVEPEQLQQALDMTEIVSVQNHYNVANREHEDVLKLCEKQGIAFIPYFPMGGGKLTAADGPLAEYTEKYSAQPSQIALAWLLHHSPVTLPIPGTSSREHLESNIAAAGIQLSSADVQALDELKV